jgi:twitching motility protein PilT
MNIHALFRETAVKKASDLHLTVGLPPMLRINGNLLPMNLDKLTKENLEELLKPLLTESRKTDLLQRGDTDFSYAVSGLARFRINAFRQKGLMALVARLIPENVPTLKSLGYPAALEQLARKTKGLILVTGPTGSGKSTTLAAMIDQINRERNCHIITLEDPIEYLHGHKSSIVTQRELHTDTRSFALALRAVLREDPDVILVGEMRDAETIGTAITAAETGHLVFATLHTVDSAQTIDRIIDVFPGYQQQQIRTQLSMTLQGIISQQLIPNMDNTGRVAALEILIATSAIRHLIREGKTHQIPAIVQTGIHIGMQSMDMALKKLYQNGLISHNEALLHAIDGAAFL